MLNDLLQKLQIENKLKLRGIVFYPLILILPFYIFYLVNRYGIDVPFWDQWELVPLLKNLHYGDLTFSDLWAQHNEHRIFFPRILMLLLAYLTDWNIMYELYLNVILAGLTFWSLYLLLRESLSNGISPWLMVIMSFLIFSPAQWENWSWGWQIQIFLNVLCIVTAILAVSKWPGQLKGISIAIVFSFMASFSFNNGLLAWVVIGAILFFQQKKNKGHLALWVAATAATFFFYYKGYTKPGYHPSLLYALKHPYDYVRYIFAYLGTPLGNIGQLGDIRQKDVAITIGLFFTGVLLACSISLFKYSKEETYKLLPLLALALYSILSAAATGIGRVGFGVDQALSSRYATFSTPFFICTVAIFFVWLRNYRREKKELPARMLVIISSVTTLVILSYALTFSSCEKYFRHRKAGIEAAKGCLENANVANDECLKKFYPNAAIVRERTKMLLEMGLLKRLQLD